MKGHSDLFYSLYPRSVSPSTKPSNYFLILAQMNSYFASPGGPMKENKHQPPQYPHPDPKETFHLPQISTPKLFNDHGRKTSITLPSARSLMSAVDRILSDNPPVRSERVNQRWPAPNRVSIPFFHPVYNTDFHTSQQS